MYILGIDTATKVAGAAVVKDGTIISERYIHNKLTHSELLLGMVDQVMQDAGLTVSELNGVSVVGGPGSFTGLRIGMAFGKTLAQVLHIPIAAVSTLRVLAYNVEHFHGIICPIMDARKNEVYTAVYHSGCGKLEQVSKGKASSIQQLAEELQHMTGPVIFVGDGVPVFFDDLADSLGVRAQKANPLNCFTRAGAVALLGMEYIQSGEAADPFNLSPVYLRKSEAEITWEKRRGESPDEEDSCHDLCPS